MAAAVETAEHSGRRQVDASINLIPMIDLFVVCISFLLITAVWAQWGRLEASALVPGNGPMPAVANPVLHLALEGDHFTLTWKTGDVVHSRTTLPADPRDINVQGTTFRRYPSLATAITREWESQSSILVHDDNPVTAVVSVDDATPFEDITAMIDAVGATKRTGPRGTRPAFRVSFGKH